MKDTQPVNRDTSNFSINKGLTESDLAYESGVSAKPWEDVFFAIRLPENVSGLRILDVGGGASDATARLLELGADAYSVDPRYKSKSEMRGLLKKEFKHGHHTGEDLLLRIKALDRFTESAKADPDRYRTAFATSLPFPEGYFDMVFSVDAVSYYLNTDRKILQETMRECLRVLKPQGTVQFFPFDEYGGDWNEEENEIRSQNDKWLISWLKAHPEVETVSVERLVPTRENGRERLVVVKKPGHP